jgi:hypothetical protein
MSLQCASSQSPRVFLVRLLPRRRRAGRVRLGRLSSWVRLRWLRLRARPTRPAWPCGTAIGRRVEPGRARAARTRACGRRWQIRIIGPSRARTTGSSACHAAAGRGISRCAWVRCGVRITRRARIACARCATRWSRLLRRHATRGCCPPCGTHRPGRSRGLRAYRVCGRELRRAWHLPWLRPPWREGNGHGGTLVLRVCGTAREACGRARARRPAGA